MLPYSFSLIGILLAWRVSCAGEQVNKYAAQVLPTLTYINVAQSKQDYVDATDGGNPWADLILG
jgi:hypothetical protein